MHRIEQVQQQCGGGWVGGLKGTADGINSSDLVQQFILLLNSWIINYELWAFVCHGDFLSLRSKECIKFEII